MDKIRLRGVINRVDTVEKFDMSDNYPVFRFGKQLESVLRSLSLEDCIRKEMRLECGEYSAFSDNLFNSELATWLDISEEELEHLIEGHWSVMKKRLISRAEVLDYLSECLTEGYILRGEGSKRPFSVWSWLRAKWSEI
jgi:hypothetical protein